MLLVAAAPVRNHSKNGKVFFTALALLLATNPAYSQSQSVQAKTVTMHGSVIDASGAVIPGATLMLEGKKSIVLQVAADKEGNFTMEAQPNEYILEVSSPGFSTYKQPIHLVETTSIGITLQVDQHSGLCSPCIEPVSEIKLLDASLTSTLPLESLPPFKLRAKRMKKLYR